MPIYMTQQEVAEWILDILVNGLELKPGDSVPDQQLKQKYRERNGDSGNIPAGLEYAGDHEWLSWDAATDRWHLTELGHESA